MNDKDFMRPMNWGKEEWKDVAKTAALAVPMMAELFVILWIFG
jgi:hypothetical protein